MGVCSSNNVKRLETNNNKLIKKATLNRGKTYLADRNNKEYIKI